MYKNPGSNSNLFEVIDKNLVKQKVSESAPSQS